MANKQENEMGVEEITNEEAGKLAGILETKWDRTVDDLNKRTEELDAERVANGILQRDVDYWHARALAAEARGDKHWADMDFMLQQWNKLRAMSSEVDRAIKRGILGPAQQQALPPADDPPPSIVVFDRPN